MHRLMMRRMVVFVSLAALVSLGENSSQAGAIRGNAGFNTVDMHRNDDESEGPISLGATYDFFGVSFSELYVNTNGNVTVDGSGLGTYTPFDLTSTSRYIIAPFFADVDTRVAGEPVRYGADTVDGHAAFGVNWLDVDYFSSSTEHTNRNFFQLVLIDRSDIGLGDFDIEFNYNQIQWEAGTASSSDENGLGGFSARAGFSNGSGDPDTFYELPGSAINGAFLDGGINALITHRLNSSVDGRYLFNVRNGLIEDIPPVVGGVPEPSSCLLMGLGALGLFIAHRRRQK
ncbi:MAG: nidogen-like domain-containing protein [Planctomycetaceae bacterium]